MGFLRRTHLHAVPQSSARDGDTSGRLTNTEATVHVVPTIPEPSEAMLNIVAALAPVKAFRIEMGTTLPEFAAELIEDDARVALREAMKYLDCDEYRDLHLRISNFVDQLDDVAAVLKERGRS
jgi:hypothetical protein